MPIAYCWSRDTGEFVGTVEARIDPMDKNNVLYPAYSTPMQPDAPIEGFVFRYLDDNGSIPTHHPEGAWKTECDPRGTWWNENGDPVVVDNFNHEIIHNGTREKPPVPFYHVLKNKSWQIDTNKLFVYKKQEINRQFIRDCETVVLSCEWAKDLADMKAAIWIILAASVARDEEDETDIFHLCSELLDRWKTRNRRMSMLKALHDDNSCDAIRHFDPAIPVEDQKKEP